MLVIIDAPLPDDKADAIRKLSPTIRLHKVAPFGQPLPADALREAEVIYTTAANFDPADAPKLRWVQTDTAATNPQRSSPVLRSAVPVANVSGAYSAAVAECAVGMLLAVTRRITLGVRAQLQRHWPTDYKSWAGDDLYGKTMGIVGYGSIGRQIARIVHAMGMTVLACKRNPHQHADDAFCLPGTGDPEGTIPRAWFGQDQLADMFRQCDVAMITLPDVPSTHGLIGAAALAALPRHAYLVNVGRGGVIDEPALVARLQAGALAGAALDVFAAEPLPATSPLWDLTNVLIMPHIASWTTMQADRASAVLLENLRRDLAGLPLLNLIDKELLY